MFLDRSWPTRGRAADIYMFLRPVLTMFQKSKSEKIKIKIEL